jgi:hypothetical protein
MNTKQTSGLEEATHYIQTRFGSSLCHEIPCSILHMDASSPYASMHPHQALVALSALQHTQSRVITIATSAGFYSEYASLWGRSELISCNWTLALHQAHHLHLNKIEKYVPVFVGGLDNVAKMRRERLLALWRRIDPKADESRLSVVDLATHSLVQNTRFYELFDMAPPGERIGRIPCPYCSYKLSRKTGKREFVSHWIKASFPNVSVEHYHAKCPIKRIIKTMLESTLAEVIQKTGLALTGRFAYRWFSRHLSCFDADAIMIKDHSNAAGALKAVVETIPEPSKLLVSTRTRCGFSMEALEGLDDVVLTDLVARHWVLSDGREFVC